MTYRECFLLSAISNIEVGKTLTLLIECKRDNESGHGVNHEWFLCHREDCYPNLPSVSDYYLFIFAFCSFAPVETGHW